MTGELLVVSTLGKDMGGRTKGPGKLPIILGKKIAITKNFRNVNSLLIG